MANWYSASGTPAPAACLQYTTTNGPTCLLTFSVVLDESWEEDAEVTEHPVEVGSNVADHVRVALVKCTLKVFNTNEPVVGAQFGQSSNTVTMASYPDSPTRGALTLPVPTAASLGAVPTWTVETLAALTYSTWDNPIEERALLQLAAGTVGSAAGGATGSVIGAAAGGLLGALLLSAKPGSATVGTSAGLTTSAALVPPANFDVDTWPNQAGGGTDYVAALHQLLVNLKNAAQQFTVMATKGALLAPMVIESLSFSRDEKAGSGEYVTIGLRELRIVTTQTVPAPIPRLPSGGGKPTVSHGTQDPKPTPPKPASLAVILINALTPGGPPLTAADVAGFIL
jgi:hypothetical protein